MRVNWNGLMGEEKYLRICLLVGFITNGRQAIAQMVGLQKAKKEPIIWRIICQIGYIERLMQSAGDKHMNKRIWNILFLGVLIVLMSCSSMKTNDVKQLPSSTNPYAASSPALTLTYTTIAIPTNIRTTFIPTDTPKLEFTPTVFLPSLTPLVTLSGTEFNQLVSELLLNNAGCQYPCWWGITPGKTSWSEANHFLASFVEVTPFGSTNGAGHVPFEITYLVKYPLQNERGRGGFNVNVFIDQIKTIFVGTDSTNKSSLLHQVLTNYGSPDQIYIQTHRNAPSNDIPLILVLFYPSKNFLVAYELNAYADNDELVSCANGESPGLWIWSDDVIVNQQRISGLDLRRRSDYSIEAAGAGYGFGH